MPALEPQRRVTELPSAQVTDPQVNNAGALDWERDYPLFARGRRGASQSTVILLEFELDETEQLEFKEATGISTNQRLPIQVTISKNKTSLVVPKQGKGVTTTGPERLRRSLWSESEFSCTYRPFAPEKLRR